MSQEAPIPNQYAIGELDNWVEAGVPVSNFSGEEDWVPPPVGVYHFQCIRKDPNTPVSPQYDETGTRVQAKFYFMIVDAENPNLNGQEIRQFYTISLNEKANLRPVVEALIGRELLPTDVMGWKDGQTADGRTVVGIGMKYMTATLIHHKSQNGKTYPRLIGAIPYDPVPKKGRKAKAEAEPEIDMDKVPF